jgi:hypothetical protein
LPASQAETVDQVKQPDYASVETARLQEIQDNLSNYYQTQQDLFKDRARFNDFFHYEDRKNAPEQQAILDKFYNDKERERKITGKTPAQIAKDGDDVEFLKLTDPQLYNQIQTEKKNLTDKKENTNTLLTLAQQYGFTDIDKD